MSLPQPIVLFDAVGTVIYPDPPAVEVYQGIARQQGVILPATLIRSRFQTGFREYFANPGKRYECPADESTEKLKWQQVVQTVFAEAYTDELFANLWQHFACPDHWSCFPDANSTIDELLREDIPVAIASNFDCRLEPIIRGLFSEFPSMPVFCSTEIGFSKPDVRFFTGIEKRLAGLFGRVQPLMIGDHWVLDVEVSQRAGWRSIWKSGERLPKVKEITNHFFRRT